MQDRPYKEDPELGDENDPAYKEEMFQTFKYMGWSPEQLKDPKDQQEYADWLANSHGEEKDDQVSS